MSPPAPTRPPSPPSPGPVASIRFGAWYDDRDLALDFPDGWQVESCPPADGPDIGRDGIARAFAHPIGTPPLRELARGRKRACIVIDDLSRPTPGERLVPVVLDELAAAGIGDRDVLVLAGVANHRPMTRPDFEKKVGREVLARCAVANHFSWDGCVSIGTTRFGSPVELNADFLRADLKILVGSIIPHGAAGFSGGSKLLFPGIASLASAEAYHRGTCTRGRYAVVETDARLESDDAARLAGVDFLVNGIPSSRLGLAGLVPFLIGLGLLFNGIFLGKHRTANAPPVAPALPVPSTNQLNEAPRLGSASVVEHTTAHLPERREAVLAQRGEDERAT